LTGHRWGRGDHDEVDPAPKDELTKDQTGFDGFAGAHVIRDQKVDAGQREGLSERNQLIGIEMDAGSEWSLQQLPIRCGRSVPANGAQIGREHLRVIGAAELSERTLAVGNAVGKRS
jgi:hypothetical protein